jgi:hypothetical protein
MREKWADWSIPLTLTFTFLSGTFHGTLIWSRASPPVTSSGALDTTDTSKAGLGFHFHHHHLAEASLFVAAKNKNITPIATTTFLIFYLLLSYRLGECWRDIHAKNEVVSSQQNSNAPLGAL